MKRLLSYLLLSFFLIAPGLFAGLMGQEILVLPDKEAQPTLVRAIQHTQTSVDLSLYHLDDPGCIQALCDVAKAGKKVRVILTKPDLWPKPFDVQDNAKVIKKLKESGVEVAFLKDFDYTLNHSKFMIIDGKQAWVCTFNFDPFNFGSTRNFGVRMNDASTVQALQEIFDNDFRGESKKNDQNVTVLRDKHIILGPQDQKEFFLDFLNSAEHSIHIYQQDLSDPDIGDILRKQALAGREVKILMTPYPFGGIDMNRVNHTHIQNDRGQVKFSPKRSLYIHAKIVVLDGGTPQQKIYIGSCNFWPEALKRNRELGVILSDDKSVGSVQKTFNDDWEKGMSFEAAKAIDDAKG